MASWAAPISEFVFGVLLRTAVKHALTHGRKRVEDVEPSFIVTRRANARIGRCIESTALYR